MTAPAKSRGIDVASFQHPGGKPIVYEDVAKAGYTFAMIKATQGDSYTNPYLKEDFEGFHSVGMMCGAYHFYEPGINAAAQAEYFIHALVQRTTDLGVWLDWEPASMADWEVSSAYNEFMAECEKARKPMGLYVDGSWHAKFVALNLPIKRLWFADPSGVPMPTGTMISQGEAETVPGIAAACDIDELWSIRGINVARPPTAAEEPFVPESDEQPHEVTETVADPAPEVVPADVPAPTD